MNCTNVWNIIFDNDGNPEYPAARNRFFIGNTNDGLIDCYSLQAIRYKRAISHSCLVFHTDSSSFILSILTMQAMWSHLENDMKRLLIIIFNIPFYCYNRSICWACSVMSTGGDGKWSASWLWKECHHPCKTCHARIPRYTTRHSSMYLYGENFNVATLHKELNIMRNLICYLTWVDLIGFSLKDTANILRDPAMI